MVGYGCLAKTYEKSHSGPPFPPLWLFSVFRVILGAIGGSAGRTSVLQWGCTAEIRVETEIGSYRDGCAAAHQKLLKASCTESDRFAGYERNGKRAGRMQRNEDELREFLLVLRRALLMVVRWIEQRYVEQRHDVGTPPTS